MSEPSPPTRRARKDAPPLPGIGAAEAARSAAVPESASPGSDEPHAWGSSPASPTFFDDDDRGRLATAQLEMAAFGDHLIPYLPPAAPPPPSFAPWALAAAVLALVASLFTGWLVPLGAVAVVLSIISLRRAHDSVRMAVWSLCLAVVSVAFSAGWLIWGFSQLAVV